MSGMSSLSAALTDFAVAHHTALLALAILSSLFCYKAFLYPRYFSKLRHIPGPPLGHWLFGQIAPILQREAGLPQLEWIERYAGQSPCIRIVGPFGLERLVFKTPNAMEAILVTHCYDFPRPKMVRGVLAFATGYGLLTVEGDEHRAMRRLMTPSFSLAHLAQIVPDFYSSIDICVKLLNKAVEEQDDGDGAILDMYPRMSHLTLDIICQTAFGYDCDCQNNPESELAVHYERIVNLQNGPNLAKMLLICALPYGEKLFSVFKHIPIASISGPIGSLDDAMKHVKRVARQMLRDKSSGRTSEEASSGKDVLSLLVKANRGEGGKTVLSEEQMMDQVLTILGAGHETTATGMSWTLWLLSKNLDVQAKLRDEVADLIGRKREPSMDDLNSLPYLTAVVKESLRVMPPVPATARQASVDSVIDGVVVPKGTLLYIGVRVINTLKELWGEDANEFKPERWLGIADGKTPGGSRYAWQSFIAGPHGCIGAPMSMLEMKAMLAVLCSHFSFEWPKGQEPVVPKAAITMKPESSMKLRVRKVRTAANEY